MDVFAHYPAWILAAAAGFMLLGGFVKGAVGFALPMIVVSGLGSILSAEETIGILIIPVALANLWQTLRQGLGAAGDTLRQFWRLNLAMGVVIALVAQAVPQLPDWWLFTFLGVVVAGAALVQLLGWHPTIRPAGRARAEVATGVLAGIAGGISGIWGPPILLFLIACGAGKTVLIRAQGIAFLIGSVILVGAHVQSGVLNGATAPVGTAMVPFMAAGMMLGFRLQDRLDQQRFRRMTLVVLAIAGLNLLRRGLMG